MKLCAVSIDLDEINHYHAIHGLGPPEGKSTHAVYDSALPRFERFASAHDLPLTLFAIGRDCERFESVDRLRSMVAAGHELGNHSLDHRYDLTELSRAEIHEQVQGGIDTIERATGSRPRGFRAPGYTVSDVLFEVLSELRVEFDSSVFPCPSYYAAKASVLGWKRLTRVHTRAILDQPNVLRAPRRPYRIGKPYWRRGRGMPELPIQVTRALRLPFIGTSLTLAGPARARLLTKMVIGEEFVNLELHGIDALDVKDELAALLRHQPDVKIRTDRKLEALGAAIEALRDAGYSFVRLSEAVERLMPRGL